MVENDSEIYLIKPSEQDCVAVMEFRMEFLENNEVAYGTEHLYEDTYYDTWLSRVRYNECKKTDVCSGPPCYEFLAIRKCDDRLVGMINLRYNLTEDMYRYLGHIGYCVRKSERRKGYAAKMLQLVLQEAKKIGLDKVLLTVDSDKVASIATMKKNGAILENEIPYQGKITQRYWITIN